MAAEQSGVYVTLQRGEDLRSCDLNGKSDPYVKVRLFNGLILCRAVKSSTQYKTLNPVWNEEVYAGALHDHDKAYLGVKLQSCYIRFQVWDEDRVTFDDFIGEAKLTWTEIGDGGSFVMNLLDKKGLPQAGNKLYVSVRRGPPVVSKGYVTSTTIKHHGASSR